MRGVNAGAIEFDSHEDYAIWYAIEEHELDKSSAWAEWNGDNNEGPVLAIFDDLGGCVELLVSVFEDGLEPLYEALEY